MCGLLFLYAGAGIPEVSSVLTDMIQYEVLDSGAVTRPF